MNAILTSKADAPCQQRSSCSDGCLTPLSKFDGHLLACVAVQCQLQQRSSVMIQSSNTGVSWIPVQGVLAPMAEHRDVCCCCQQAGMSCSCKHQSHLHRTDPCRICGLCGPMPETLATVHHFRTDWFRQSPRGHFSIKKSFYSFFVSTLHAGAPSPLVLLLLLLENDGNVLLKMAIISV